MSEHPNATTIRNMWDAVGRGDMAALAARFTGGAADFQMTGETHDVVGNDDHTVALLSATATRGGRSLSYRVAEIYHFSDGKITERWAFSDDTAAIAAFFA